MKGDTPAKQVNIMDMDDDTLTSWLLGIRERRLKAVQIFEESEAQREQARKLNLEKKLEHELKMFEKERIQLDKVIEKIEKRVVSLRVLNLQLEE